MGKGLETFEELKFFIPSTRQKEVNVVEKKLKERENLATMCDELAELVGLKDKDYLELKELIKKKLKVLEIIINYCCVIQKGILPREKQDLLDEVLSCH